MALIEEEISEKIIGAAIRVHRELGPGLMESVYEACLAYELSDSGLAVRRQVPLPVRYRQVSIDEGYRLDLVVNNAVIVELKSVERIAAIHEAQLMTYLRLSGYPLALLINFNVPLLRDGIVRRVLTHAPSSPRSPRTPR
jgi:GxxExxY protein